MLINRFGSSIVIDGTTYTIGMRVCGTDTSEYEGLFGSILEIRDGEDKETDNDTTDIICYFNPPENSYKVKQLEERFSVLYGMKKELDDISLDYVIMAPEMIREVKRCRIYQIDPLNAEFAFRSLADVQAKGLEFPPDELYKAVFDGQLDTDDLEDIFAIFNMNHPEGYRGRSLSMSDIVELYDESGGTFFYCDTIGFKQVPFKPNDRGDSLV